MYEMTNATARCDMRSLASMTAELPSRLKQVFGYDEFRPLQREIMGSALEGRDTVAILPTGAGKSLCYQLPALVREGLTVVVSPLIALMKDQVDQLRAAGVAATFLNSSLDLSSIRQRTQQLSAGQFKLLYVAPERLMMGDFLPRLATGVSRRWRWMKRIALANGGTISAPTTATSANSAGCTRICPCSRSQPRRPRG